MALHKGLCQVDVFTIYSGVQYTCNYTLCIKHLLLNTSVIKMLCDLSRFSRITWREGVKVHSWADRHCPAEIALYVLNFKGLSCVLIQCWTPNTQERIMPKDGKWRLRVVLPCQGRCQWCWQWLQWCQEEKQNVKRVSGGFGVPSRECRSSDGVWREVRGTWLHQGRKVKGKAKRWMTNEEKENRLGGWEKLRDKVTNWNKNRRGR